MTQRHKVGNYFWKNCAKRLTQPRWPHIFNLYENQYLWGIIMQCIIKCNIPVFLLSMTSPSFLGHKASLCLHRQFFGDLHETSYPVFIFLTHPLFITSFIILSKHSSWEAFLNFSFPCQMPSLVLPNLCRTSKVHASLIYF